MKRVLSKCPLALVLALSVFCFWCLQIKSAVAVHDSANTAESTLPEGAASESAAPSEAYDAAGSAETQSDIASATENPSSKDSSQSASEPESATTDIYLQENSQKPLLLREIPSKSSAEEIAGAQPGDVIVQGVTCYRVTETKNPRSEYYFEDNRIALTSDCDYTDVDLSYYNDALFIGDSRIDGMRDYSGIETADFFCKPGLTIFDLMEAKVADTGNGTESIADALSQKQYGKIYIMVGINELGYGNTDRYYSAYTDVVSKIQQLQPDAVIIIFGMTHVTQEYSDGDSVFNNDNIDNRNCAIASLADGVNVIYMDMNECTDDESGALNALYSSDGVHLKAQYYRIWTEWLNEHGLTALLP